MGELASNEKTNGVDARRVGQNGRKNNKANINSKAENRGKSDSTPIKLPRKWSQAMYLKKQGEIIELQRNYEKMKTMIEKKSQKMAEQMGLNLPDGSIPEIESYYAGQTIPKRSKAKNKADKMIISQGAQQFQEKNPLELHSNFPQDHSAEEMVNTPRSKRRKPSSPLNSKRSSNEEVRQQKPKPILKSTNTVRWQPKSVSQVDEKNNQQEEDEDEDNEEEEEEMEQDTIENHGVQNEENEQAEEEEEDEEEEEVLPQTQRQSKTKQAKGILQNTSTEQDEDEEDEEEEENQIEAEPPNFDHSLNYDRLLTNNPRVMNPYWGVSQKHNRTMSFGLYGRNPLY